MAAPHGFIERLAELAAGGAPLVSVTLVDAVGSTPQDVGSKMLVTAAGLDFGTVGGGRLEAKAIAEAQVMLTATRGRDAGAKLVEWNLQRDVGMTCGGLVRLYFETYNHADWQIVLFGAGHVAAAVVHCLTPLPCRITVIDPRDEWLGRIGAHGRVTALHMDEPADHVARLPDDAFVVCMTMGHRTDRPILDAIFRQGRRFPFVGVIGSAAKRKVLERELSAAGATDEQLATLYCPLGLPLGSNQPGEIAVSVVAQLLQERDAWRAMRKTTNAS